MIKNDTNELDSNVLRLEFNNCEITTLNDSILNEQVFSNLVTLKISNHIKQIQNSSIKKLKKLKFLDFELENMVDFIGLKPEFDLNSLSNITLNDLSNNYTFPDDDYCFFDNLNRSGVKIVFQTSAITSFSCTLKLLNETNSVSQMILLSDNKTCNKTIECQTIIETSTATINQNSSTTSLVSTSSQISDEEKIKFLFISLVMAGLLLLISIIVAVIFCCKYRRLKSFKSDVAYELDPVHNDNFE